MRQMQSTATMPGGFNIPLAANQPGLKHVATVMDGSEFTCIHNRHINLAIWQRQVSQGLVDFVDNLIIGKIPNESRTIATAQTRVAIASYLAQIWPEPTLGRQLLCHDVSNMAELFTNITGARRIKISILGSEPEAGWSEPVFETGAYSARLQVTYRGPGLEWIANDAVDRDMLETRDNTLICNDSSSIRRLPRFTASFAKGPKFEGNENNGLVQRQPLPDTGKGEDRMILRLDRIR